MIYIANSLNDAVWKVILAERNRIYQMNFVRRFFYKKRLKAIDEWLDKYEWEKDKPRRDALKKIIADAEAKLEDYNEFIKGLIE